MWKAHHSLELLENDIKISISSSHVRRMVSVTEYFSEDFPLHQDTQNVYINSYADFHHMVLNPSEKIYFTSHGHKI